MAISFGGKVLIAPYLGSTKYGLLSIGMTVLILSGILATFGLNTGIAQYLPRHSDPQDRMNLIITGMSVTLIISVLISIIIFTFSPTISTMITGNPDNHIIIKIFSLAIPVHVLNRYFTGVTRGQKQTIPKVLANKFAIPTSRLIIFIIAIYFGYETLEISIGYIISFTISVVILIYFLIRSMDDVSLPPRNIKIQGSLISFSFPLLIGAAMDRILTRFDRLLIGAIQGPTEVGVYSVAYPMALLLMIVITSFGHLYLPLVTEVQKKKNKQTADLFWTVSKWISILTIPLFLILFLHPEFFIEGVFGTDFSTGQIPFMILCVGFLLNSVMGPGGLTLTGIGLSKIHMGGNIIATIFNIALNLLLIPIFGLVGAALATTLAYVIQNIYYLLALRLTIFSNFPHQLKEMALISVISSVVVIPIIILSIIGERGLISIIISSQFVWIYIYLIFKYSNFNEYEKDGINNIKSKIHKFINIYGYWV